MPRKNTTQTGSIYGRLEVIGPLERDPGNSEDWWVCLCECGKAKNVRGADLRRGKTQSCGCYHRKRASDGGKRSRGGGRRAWEPDEVWSEYIEDRADERRRRG